MTCLLYKKYVGKILLTMSGVMHNALVFYDNRYRKAVQLNVKKISKTKLYFTLKHFTKEVSRLFYVQLLQQFAGQVLLMVCTKS